MKRAGDPTTAGNPFSSRHVRPGAVPFVFPEGAAAQDLVERLRAAGWRGQVVGPHGSGKSALVAALVPALEAAGRQVFLCELRAGQRRLPRDFPSAHARAGHAVVVVDGYEQLSAWGRFRLRRACASAGLGLVVTAHGPAGLPDLLRLAPDPALARRIVEWLLRGAEVRIAPEEVDAAFAARQGDLREMLFDLYDLFERRLRERA